MSASRISPGVQTIIASLDGWNEMELAVLKSAIALVEKRRQKTDAVTEANRICLGRHSEAVADFFADCEGILVDERA